MGLNYAWYKNNSITMPHRCVFNCFFKVDASRSFDDSFAGLELTKGIDEYIKNRFEKYRFLNQKERFYKVFSITGNILRAMFVLMPIVVGALASAAFLFLLLMSFFVDDLQPPWDLLIVTLVWNLCWLNFRFINSFMFNSFNGAYIDRQNQTISFTWRVKGNPPTNEFGHATFALTEVEAFYKTEIKNQQGGLTHALCIAHKDHARYRGAFLKCSVADNPRDASSCFLEWEMIQRFADNSLPLPDIPELEDYRSLDSITIKYDKTRQRPNHYWREMHYAQQRKIANEVKESAHNFGFEQAHIAPYKNETFKPWLTWPIDPKFDGEHSAKNQWIKRMKVLCCQLTLGIAW